MKWTVHDDNDDQMVYSVYYRGDGETRWLLLKDNLTDKFYSFDASLLPDGGYTVEGAGFGCAFAFSRPGADFNPGQRPLRSGYHSAEHRRSQSVAGGRPNPCEPFAPPTDFPISSALNIPWMPAIGNMWNRSANWQIPKPPVMTSRFQCRQPGNTGLLQAKKMSLEHVVVVRVYDRFDNMSSAKTVIRK